MSTLLSWQCLNCSLYNKKSRSICQACMTPIANNPNTKKQKLIKKLTSILNKVTPEKLTKLYTLIIDIISEFTQTEETINITLDLIFQFGINQPTFAHNYAKLCLRLYKYLMDSNKKIAKTFRKMIDSKCNNLFKKYHVYDATQNYDKQKSNLFGILIVIAELYTLSLLKRLFIIRNIFKHLLPTNFGGNSSYITQIDIEGLCKFIMRCGRKLDCDNRKDTTIWLNNICLLSKEKQFDFRIKVIVQQLMELRENEWREIKGNKPKYKVYKPPKISTSQKKKKKQIKKKVMKINNNEKKENEKQVFLSDVGDSTAWPYPIFLDS